MRAPLPRWITEGISKAEIEVALGHPYQWPDPANEPLQFIGFGRAVLAAIRDQYGDDCHDDCLLLAGIVRDREFYEWRRANDRWNAERKAAGLPSSNATLFAEIDTASPEPETG